MDIRKYFEKPKVPVSFDKSLSEIPLKKVKINNLEEQARKISEQDEKTSNNKDNLSNIYEPMPSTSKEILSNSSAESANELQVGAEKTDVGNFISTNVIDDVVKYNILVNPFTPSTSYNFKEDALEENRVFRREWLQTYDWMVYSKKLKGALCKLCIVFKPVVHRGLQGAFIKKAFSKYRHLHESAKCHANSEWHKNSVYKTTHFLKTFSGKAYTVAEQININDRLTVEANRKKLFPIVSSIIFCGTHDIALRGKESDGGNFEDLLDFRVESGDQVLKEHLDTSARNAKYTSHRCQNEIINTCGDIVRRRIIKEVNDCNEFSLLADETADIGGKEQLSIGVRFVDKSNTVREEFLGFTELKSMSAQSISHAILTTAGEYGLHLNNLVGLGFDGCSTMSGKENGVQKQIRDKYPKATFFHCSLHKLNLVVNDLNSVLQVQNCIAIIKEVIKFFRESPKRRDLVSNIPLLSETRWTAKYKSIRLFSQNFISTKKVLCNISTNSDFNNQSRHKAEQLYSSTSTPTFLICLAIITTYSSQLEPVTNVLQGISVDLLSVKNHIQNLITIFQQERENPDLTFSEIFKTSQKYAKEFEIEIKIPRITQRQTLRPNVSTESTEQYFKISLFIPYLDSLISSLQSRFSDDTTTAFSISHLHPLNISKLNPEIIRNIQEKYSIENFEAECHMWINMWKNKATVSNDIDFFKILDKDCQFFPAISKALRIFLSLPPTTCSIERSFSTLRRVKTWLRSTMTESRLSGLCLLSVHRQKVNGDHEKFIEEVIDTFGQDKRRIKFMFTD